MGETAVHGMYLSYSSPFFLPVSNRVMSLIVLSTVYSLLNELWEFQVGNSTKLNKLNYTYI